MQDRYRLFLIISLVALLFSAVALSGVTPSHVSAQNRVLDKDEEGEEEADVPPRWRGLIDKGEYLMRRNDHVNKLRGLPYDTKDNPRVRAIRQMEAQEQQLAPEISVAKWESVGPAPIPNGQTSPSTPVSGRTISIAVHPTNPNTTYVGTANGGVYRTTDGGATWRAIFDSAMSLAVGAIAIAPSDPTTIFVGTGEPNFSCDSFFGVGIYRITNADTTPTLAGPLNLDGSATDVMSGRSIGKIVVHPTDPNIIFVSTTTGIGGIGCDLPTVQPSRGLFRSMNAMGLSPTFEKITVGTENGGNRNITDIVMEPGTPNNLVCAVVGFNTAGSGGIYRTTDALAATPTFTRTLIVGTAASTFRTELAINKVGMVTTVYAAIGEPSGIATCNNAGQSGTLKRSTDGGQTWSAAIAAANGFCGTQCVYDISLAVDPANANNVLLGGNVNSTCSRLAARSTNGGTSFTSASSGVHADNHVAAFAPSNSSIAYMGTDGGIYKSTNGGAAWTSISNTGFNATQFQSLALHPIDREFMIGGTQDNGTEFKRPDGTWTRADFGDGGFALIDQSATDTTTVTMYHTYFNQSGNLIGFGRVLTSACAVEAQWAFRGIFGGAPFPGNVCDGSLVEAFNGIGLNDDVEFYAPMALGPSPMAGQPNTLYFGTDRLYRSINRGDLMTAVSQGPIEAGQTITAVGISSQNDNVRIVGLFNGNVYRTTTGSSTLDNVTGPIPDRFVARAVIDPTNVNTAYVTLAGFGLAANQHVWKTTNLSNATPTWTAAGSGIPDVPVNAFVVDPANASNLYAGTDIGVYRSTDGGASWNPFNSGLPRVAVFDMAIQNPNRVLRIATHGRGIWEISLSAFTLAKLSESFNASGGMGTVNVTGPNGPTWTATTTDSWIIINNAGPGTGNGTVTYTVGQNMATTSRAGKITIANQTFTVLQGAAFLDVPVGHIFYNQIGKLSARGITVGCGGGNYCPDQVVTREQMAAFIIRAIGEFDPLTPPSQRFGDVPPSNPFYNFIEQMAVRGITSGCSTMPLLYCPSGSVTREQMAAFIIRGIGEFSPPLPAMQRFGDVPPSNPFYNFIDRMAVLGITSGCSAMPPLYCPTAPVTRGQMAVFLVVAFNL
jgi:S-layer family protein